MDYPSSNSNSGMGLNMEVKLETKNMECRNARHSACMSCSAQDFAMRQRNMAVYKNKLMGKSRIELRTGADIR